VKKENATLGTNILRHDASYRGWMWFQDGGHASLCPPYEVFAPLRKRFAFVAGNDGEGATPNTATYFFPTFSHSHCATASGELVASLPAARRLASRMVAMSILPSSGASALRKPSSLARFGASSTIAS
jgi:hypothetical protein